MSVARLLELKFNEIPYNIAKFIASADMTVSLVEKKSSVFTISVEGQTFEDTEKVIYVSTSPMYKINQNLSSVFRAIAAKFSKWTSKDEGTVILTSKKIIVKTPYSKSDFPISDAVFSFGDDISFDNSNYFCVSDINFFRFVMLNLNKTL